METFLCISIDLSLFYSYVSMYYSICTYLTTSKIKYGTICPLCFHLAHRMEVDIVWIELFIMLLLSVKLLLGETLSLWEVHCVSSMYSVEDKDTFAESTPRSPTRARGGYSFLRGGEGSTCFYQSQFGQVRQASPSSWHGHLRAGFCPCHLSHLKMPGDRHLYCHLSLQY